MYADAKLAALASLAALVFMCASISVQSQTKIDADASDVAALQKRIDSASREKIPSLDQSKNGNAKYCKSGKAPSGQQSAAADCGIIGAGDFTPEGDEILAKGCSYEDYDGKLNPCALLAEHFIKENRYIEALAAVLLPNARNAREHQIAYIREEAYSALGNKPKLKEQLHYLCYDLGDPTWCSSLHDLGEQVDMQRAYRSANERDAEAAAADARREAMNEQDRQDKAASRAATIAAISDATDKTMASIQQTQADLAQARVNVAAIKMAEQNKGAGGYPTTSYERSASSSTSSTSSHRPATKSITKTTSDSNDSSLSDSSSNTDSHTSEPFNSYSSTGRGYNPYSGKGASSSDQGAWIETEIVVTCYSRSVPHAHITAVLVNTPGQPNCNGALVEFTNPDKTHPFFYGFAGIANERIEANTTRAVTWGAPYLYMNRQNPAFAARVTIKYFGVY